MATKNVIKYLNYNKNNQNLTNNSNIDLNKTEWNILFPREFNNIETATDTPSQEYFFTSDKPLLNNKIFLKNKSITTTTIKSFINSNLELNNKFDKTNLTETKINNNKDDMFIIGQFDGLNQTINKLNETLTLVNITKIQYFPISATITRIQSPLTTLPSQKQKLNNYNK